MSNPRTTVVIGGASGLGRSTAAHLASLGHRVTVADLDGPGAADVAADLDGNHLGAAVDVTDETSVAALFDRTVDHFGAFDGVVNCAGVSTLAPVVDHDAAEFRRTVDVCLNGSFLVLKHGGKRITDGGALVSLASLNARQPGPGLAAYCAAKAGLVMLSQVTALELGPRRVRVNTVSPGLVVTPLTAGAVEIPGVRDDYIDNTPLGRSGEPDEIARAVAYLLDAEWVTGENIDINGGAHLARYPDLPGLITKAFG
ncbi:SDR family NAD(P)-dependent oxidoreductase [Nocardioides alcanivorans]|uniref:SDR family NAD(P)-dependent oxidoreductase n=1 Tax=Nocardioides alcanivorans TaxID=2897352 RepID=UPI001F26B1FD|nr:SDR family oxidoreductase [Nocardioides alcanivorans]